MGFHEFWVFMVFLALWVHSQIVLGQNATCNSDDLKALEGFMNDLGSRIDGWGLNSSSNCCNWTGITCNSSLFNSRVVKLELGNRRLTGLLSDSLGALNELRTLNLSHNFLKGSLPYSLFHLPNLEVLDLSSNEFSGSIPVTTNLPLIQYLDISWNSLNGSVSFGICDNSSRIRVLDFAVNYLSGYFLPSVGNCSSLEHLDLSVNDLTGRLSQEIFRLPNLHILKLQNNDFFGELSGGIGNLTTLIRFDISSNGFSGSIPNVFKTLNKLEYFLANSNNFIGGIPISLSNSSSLKSLNLRNNSMYGQISLNCSAMVNLVSLDLGTNQFSGPVPSNLPSCLQLKNINLARNNLSGQIPDSFKHFHSLSYLSLSNASIFNLSAGLGILQQCKNLSTLVLTLNFRGEEFPSDPSFHFVNLKVLVIANCRLTGFIPEWLSGCKKLQMLDLSWNRLGESVPSWFGNFDSLFYLDLSNNSFSGEIPKSLTGLQSLINRSISLEEPSPEFPFFMKWNVSARGLQYNQVWSFPPTLDLSSNFFTGPIWPEFGNLKKLHVLDLKRNNLSGPIPRNLSGMRMLETLDLSHNNLSGTIPSSLVRLTFMSKFSVAYNQLHGEIPSGGQFQTFPNSSFEGNNLCGDHAPPCPSVNQIPFESRNKSRRNKGAIIGMAVGIGFGTVFLLSLMFLIVVRAHRQREVDPDKEDASVTDCGELGSRLVVLFQNKENRKELTLDDLLKTTNNFDQANIIGCGGFGLVYKATLPDGMKIAIKRLSGDSGQKDREFHAEVETLSRAQHPNLVLLQGYCVYKNDRLLIYSYMENNSLDFWLHEKHDGPSSLDWDARLRIAQGAARGLAYLHQSCEPRILHRDIKSSNILLDENFQAHVADFGLARLILPYDTHVTTDLVGTLGYIPPEYGQASVATYKGDVYSFGVVLLEILTGRRPMDMCKPRNCRDLISWVIQMKREHKESEVFDPFIYSKENDKEMLEVLEIACLCLSECPKVRPSTQQLVSWLDKIDVNT